MLSEIARVDLSPHGMLADPTTFVDAHRRDDLFDQESEVDEGAMFGYTRLQEAFGEAGPEGALRIEWVGPKAGQQLRDAAIQSLLYAIAFIMLYVAFRFDLRFAPGGVIAMLHDALITLGIYVLFQKEVNLTTVAALLTIMGYSINDTIVVFDRIRENSNIYRRLQFETLVNHSIVQTLQRSINTQLMTVEFMLLALVLFGGVTLREFALVLLIGLFMGTYSSIFIAAPTLVAWENREWRTWFQRGTKQSTA